MAIFGINEDLSIVSGDHQWALGGQGTMWFMNSYADAFNELSFDFNGQFTGLGMADFFTGRAADLEMGTNAAQNKAQTYIALYFADIWKVNPRLTLNYGVRMEPYFPIRNNDGSGSHFDLDAFNQGLKSSRFDNAPPGLFFQGDSGYPGAAGQNKKWWNFAPRLGLAWDITGDGRTSLRVSGGTFYDSVNARFLVGLSNAIPWTPRLTRENVDFADPWANEPGGDPFPLPFGRGVPGDTPWSLYPTVTSIDYDSPNMRMDQWNLSLQRQIGADWLVSASYLGNHTIHLSASQFLNPSVFLGLGPCTLNGVFYRTCSTTGNTNQRRRLSLANPEQGQYYGRLQRVDTGATASYNGLLVSIQRRAASGITLNANYTWSHCITDPGGIQTGTLGSQSYLDPDNRSLDRGNCAESGSDRRHLFNLTAVAETPQFSSPGLRVIASGWRFSPIFRILAGEYMTVSAGQDRALNSVPSGTQRANQVLVNPYGDKTATNYLNPAAFAQPALGTFGNIGMASIRGPGSWQFDMALSRTFRFGEARRLELRAEAFNLTNSFRMNNPTTNIRSNTFGQVLSAKDPRIMQFALKYSF
jgi:hypothetical protein